MKKSARYTLLDELRGLAVVCMVVFHGLYLAGYLFDVGFARRLYRIFAHAQPFFAGFFFFLAGVCCVFSRSNGKRGLKLAVVALLITAATMAAEEFGLDIAVYFGAIHLLAVAILLCALLYRPLGKFPPLVGILLFGLLFCITYPVENGALWLFGARIALPVSWYATKFLFPLGFAHATFSSADYYPLFPWLFAVLAGFFLGRFWQKHGFPAFLNARLMPFLEPVGRYALPVYLLHQPVLYALFYLIRRVV